MEEFHREETYRIFVSESLRLAPQHKCLAKKYTDFLKPQKIDNRSGEQIASDVMKNAGLKFKT